MLYDFGIKLLLTQIKSVKKFESVKEAYQEALKNSKSGDHIVVFGSFYTVAACKA